VSFNLRDRSFVKELDLSPKEFTFLLDQAENRMHTIKAIMVATLGS
jgi:ornithine carbamoyltransferase